MSFANVIFAVICWLCSLIFGVIALWAFKRKDPMHFWSGSTVMPEEITDIPAYNRANGLMWAIYTACMVVTGILSLFSNTIGTILLVVVSVPGLIVLIIAYNRIYNKYKNTSVTYKTDNSTSKTPKAVIIITGIVLIMVSAMLYNGSKEPVVNIFDSSIEIKAMYGLNIDFSEISDISLLDNPMNDLNIGMRTNGYGGFGQTLKGNFSSSTLGETLLFVQSKSSPTIRIERADKKDIYISFRDGEKTELLYNEIIAAIPLK